MSYILPLLHYNIPYKEIMCGYLQYAQFHLRRWPFTYMYIALNFKYSPFTYL